MQSSQNHSKPNVLIQLDALLDTRLAVVKSLYPEIAADLETNMAYRTRKDDMLNKVDPRIDLTAYTMAWLKRDVSILDYANVSMMRNYVTTLLKQAMLVSESNNPVISDVQLVVNTYPYLMDEKLANLTAIAIGQMLEYPLDVKLCYMKPSEITLPFLEQEGFSTYILYDFNEWTTAALPDVGGKDLQASGMARIENLLIVAARIALDGSKEDQVRQSFKEYGLEDMFDEAVLMPWNLLFELEMIEPIYHTIYNKQLQERLMSIVENSNNPIDLEVELMSDFYHVLGVSVSKKKHIKTTAQRLADISLELVEHLQEIAEESIDTVRVLLAEQRFLVDTLSHLIPSQPSLDFERVVDSRASAFDVSDENSVISETYYNSLMVPCRRIVRKIKSLNREAYILVAATDTTDINGKVYKKNDLLPSVHYFAPILENMPVPEMKQFLMEMHSEP